MGKPLDQPENLPSKILPFQLKLINATFVSFIVFSLLTLLSYFLDREVELRSFNLGMPWTFYYEFYTEFLHHGSNLKNFILDFGLTWVITSGAWLMIKR